MVVITNSCFKRLIFLMRIKSIGGPIKSVGGPDATSPAGLYILKANNRNPGTRYEIYSKLTIKTLASL